MNHKLSLPLLLGAVLIVAGCQKVDPAPAASAPAAEPAAVAEPAPAPMPPDDVMPLDLPEAVIDSTPVDTMISRIDASNAATETELTAPVGDEFAPADSVFLDIRTSGTAETYTISSKWFYPDGEVLTENSQIVTGAGPGSTIFSMSKPDGWAPGTYKVEFSINGKLQQTKEFTVR